MNINNFFNKFVDYAIDTRALADHVCIKHKHVYSHISRNREEYLEFGYFDVKRGKTGQSGRPQSYYEINMKHVLYYLFHSRPSEEKKELYCHIIKAASVHNVICWKKS